MDVRIKKWNEMKRKLKKRKENGEVGLALGLAGQL